MAVGSNLEDVNQMIPCERFRGEPCSSSGSQPFRVIVSPGAELLLDFHAHLSTNEVAGLLGGSWEPQERVLRSVLLDKAPCGICTSYHTHLHGRSKFVETLCKQ